MIYRLDTFEEGRLNPFTGKVFDASWIVFILTDSKEYQQFVGTSKDCVYTVKTSRFQHADWKMAAGDFISFNQAQGKHIILVMSKLEMLEVEKHYTGHSYNEASLRDSEPSVLIHSTPMSNWLKIKKDGMLKSWNRLKQEDAVREIQPIGTQLGDPREFSDYIMFGGGVTGEIVVHSKQQGKIIMNENATYVTGARLYFDAKKMAQDGLLIRDGCHLKVKDQLPLSPYLIWSATWNVLGLNEQVSTPRIFSSLADQRFHQLFG